MKNIVVKSSKINDKGVFANQDFSKGDTVLEIDDSHIVKDPSKLSRKQEEYDCDYFDGKVILMQPPEKYINHSCCPNTYVKTINGCRRILALRSIKAGEEITYDYSMNSDNEGSFVCRCGSPDCRKIYQGNFFKLPKQKQREYLPFLEEWFMAKHRRKIKELRKEAEKG